MPFRGSRRLRPRLEALEPREVPAVAAGGVAAAVHPIRVPAPRGPHHQVSNLGGAGQWFLARQTEVKTGGFTAFGNVAGFANQLNRFTGQLNFVFNPDRLHFISAGSLVATNGDLLFLTLEGALGSTAKVSSLVGTFKIQGGTGRFAGASGGGTIKGHLDSRINTLAFTFHGTIDEVVTGP